MSTAEAVPVELPRSLRTVYQVGKLTVGRENSKPSAKGETSIMGTSTIRQLDDSQVEAFDTEYVDDARWLTVKRNLDRDFPKGEFTFLDVGGGNGKFADRLLAAYPASKGTVVDNSQVLIERNQLNDRKTVLLYSVENLDRLTSRYDVIFVNWLLHHLVGDSYAQTRRNQAWTLKTLGDLLTGGGRISIFENVYDGFLIENMPGWLIFKFTENTRISDVARRLGANTAGIGVCFLSKGRWFSTIAQANLEVLGYEEPDKWNWSMPRLARICLQLRRRYVSHFWLRAQEP